MQTILVGVDGSKHSVNAFKTALAAAKTRDARLVVVSVLTKPIGYSKHLLEEHWRKQKNLFEFVHSKLLQLARELGVACSCQVRKGKPAHELLQAAVEAKAAEVFVGSHGEGLRGKLRKLLLGSVSSEVVQRAGCSVTVVR